MKRSDALCLSFILLCLAAGTARAEGCPEGDAISLTAAQKAFYGKFVPLRAALPKPEAGWQYAARTQEIMAPDYKDYLPAFTCYMSNYYLDAMADYERPMSEADSAKELQIMQSKPDPAKQKKLDDLMAQEQALMPKIMEAAQKQDTKTMDALNKQSDALNKQMALAQVDAESGSQSAMAAIEADRKASVNISLNNAGSLDCYGKPTLMLLPGNLASDQPLNSKAYSCEHPATYSSPGNPLDKSEGRIVVIYGKFTLDKDDDWDRQDATGNHTKDTAVIIRPQLDNPVTLGVHNLTIVVSADNLVRAQSLFKQLNLVALQKMVQQ